MRTVDQVRRGVARYLDTEILPKVSGWQRWVLGAGATAYLAKLDRMLQLAAQNKALAMLELMDGSGMVDVEKAYSLLRPEAEKQPATIQLPAMGRITLTVEDVDKLYQYIMNG